MQFGWRRDPKSRVPFVHPEVPGHKMGKKGPIREGFVLVCWESGHGVVFSLSPSYSGIPPCPVPGSWHRIRSTGEGTMLEKGSGARSRQWVKQNKRP